jgi:hypothetical protein
MLIAQHIKIMENALIVEDVGTRILKMFLTLYIEIETKGYFLFDKYFKYCIMLYYKRKRKTKNDNNK